MCKVFCRILNTIDWYIVEVAGMFIEVCRTKLCLEYSGKRVGGMFADNFVSVSKW